MPLRKGTGGLCQGSIRQVSAAMINESKLSVTVHESPNLQKLLSHPVPSTEHSSHCLWQAGGGVTAKRHFVVINVSESVSKAFLKSSAASNGGLAHRELHGPSFIYLTDRRNRSTGVWLQASHTHRYIHSVLVWDAKLGL